MSNKPTPASEQPRSFSTRRDDSRNNIPEPRKVYGGLLAPEDPPLSDTNVETLRAHVEMNEHKHAGEYSATTLARVLDALDIACAEIAQLKSSASAEQAQQAFDAGGALAALTLRIERLERFGADSIRNVWVTRPSRPTIASLALWKAAANETPGPIGLCINVLIAEVERLGAVLHDEQEQRAECGNCGSCPTCERLCPCRSEHGLPRGPCVARMHGNNEPARCTWCSRPMGS